MGEAKQLTLLKYLKECPKFIPSAVLLIQQTFQNMNLWEIIEDKLSCNIACLIDKSFYTTRSKRDRFYRVSLYYNC